MIDHTSLHVEDFSLNKLFAGWQVVFIVHYFNSSFSCRIYDIGNISYLSELNDIYGIINGVGLQTNRTLIGQKLRETF